LEGKDGDCVLGGSIAGTRTPPPVMADEGPPSTTFPVRNRGKSWVPGLRPA
jgi:hypothetical protein